jgi:hypothetical protein
VIVTGSMGFPALLKFASDHTLGWPREQLLDLAAIGLTMQEAEFPTALDALLSGQEPPGESLEAGYVISMAVLKQLPQLAERYVDHLRSRGYDSIICNPNEPMETVATVFEAKQIELVEWQPAWDVVLARVLEVRRQRGDENILRTALSETVASARRTAGRRSGT